MANSFTLDLRAFCAKANANMDKVARYAVTNINDRLTQRTPVGDATLWKYPPPPGYAGGHAKANWQHGFGAAPSGDLPDIDASGAASTDRVSASVNASPAAGVHYIVNNVPYAIRLEEGWSTQSPPNGIVGLTVIEWQEIADNAVNKVKGGA